MCLDGINMTNRTILTPINDEVRGYLVQFISSLISVAARNDHPMRSLARREISLTLWRWTADGMRNGEVKADALKYDVECNYATFDAIHARKEGGSGLRHEHVVPRVVLADRIISEKISGDLLYDFLIKYCQAAIVTKAEEVRIKPRCCMPQGWGWHSDPFQRYIDAELRWFKGGYSTSQVAGPFFKS